MGASETHGQAAPRSVAPEEPGMVGGRAVLTAILGGVLVACGAGVAPSPPPVAPRTEAPSVVITPATASPADTDSPPSPSLSPTSRPTPKPTSIPVPPKPIGVTFHEDWGASEITQTVTWRAPRTEGVEIRVYGVTKCIAEPAHPKPSTSGPCLVEHTPLPPSVRTQLATAPASAGTVSWTWTQDIGCNIGLEYDPDGPAYVAVVLAAYSASGHSIFAIAEPGAWSIFGPGDMPC